jgi:hypothetical protein
MGLSSHEHPKRILFTQVKDKPDELIVILIVFLIHFALAETGLLFRPIAQRSSGDSVWLGELLAKL